MRPLIDLTGRTFGELKVLSRSDSRNGDTSWNVLCSCGSTKPVRGSYLRNGRTVSCGHLQDSRRKENHRRHIERRARERKAAGIPGDYVRFLPEYRTWTSMKTRCLSPSHHAYAHYGGRGIGICERWRDSFADFYRDMGQRPSLEYSIDRIDVNGNYEPGNCKWATAQEQRTNQRSKVDSQLLVQALDAIDVALSAIEDGVVAAQVREIAARIKAERELAEKAKAKKQAKENRRKR